MAGGTNRKGRGEMEMEEWRVHYARFINFPTRNNSNISSIPPTPTTHLKPIISSRCRNANPYGNWVCSSSSASLSLSLPPKLGRHVLRVVAFSGSVYEEHYVSRLVFSWPQVSCLEDSPCRGSRVVFASYRDSFGEAQKFALRFLTSSDVQKFTGSIKESFEYVSDTALRRDNSGSEIAVPFEFSSSKGTNIGAAVESSNVNFFGTTVSPLINTSGNEEINYRFLEEPTLDPVQESTFSALPHSFTSMLSDAFRDQQEVNLLNSCCNDKPKALVEASHLKFPMVGCMGSSSFYETLYKLEMVIEELGGDLSLRR